MRGLYEPKPQKQMLRSFSPRPLRVFQTVRKAGVLIFVYVLNHTC